MRTPEFGPHDLVGGMDGHSWLETSDLGFIVVYVETALVSRHHSSRTIEQNKEEQQCNHTFLVQLSIFNQSDQFPAWTQILRRDDVTVT